MRRWVWIWPVILLMLLGVPNSFGAEKMMVLTFDDGPRPDVLFGKDGRIGLASLLRSGFEQFVPAHFFMVGFGVRKHPNIVRAVSESGFSVENHTFFHENLRHLAESDSGRETISRTIADTDALIFKTIGKYPKYFRPPYMAFSEDLGGLVSAASLDGTRRRRIAFFRSLDVNTADYRYKSEGRPASELVERVRHLVSAREKEGYFSHILIFHELGITVEALKILIPHFRDLRYSFITLDDILLKQ